LIAGQSYQFQVAAINDIGTGEWSTASNNALAAGVPSIVTGVQIGDRTTSSLSVSWNAAAPNGSAIIDYRVEYSDDNGLNWTEFAHEASTSVSTIVTGLVKGLSYKVRVTGINSQGVGTASTGVAAVPAASPAAPGSPTITSHSKNSVALTWAAPDDGGSVFTSYLIRYSADDGMSWSNAVNTASTNTAYTVRGLTIGSTYIFQVAAVNGIGTGNWSLPSLKILAAEIPAQVAGAQVTSYTDSTASLTWTAPLSNGAAISDYIIEYSPDGGISWITFSHVASSATSNIVTNLIRGTTYKFRVGAVNAEGTGAASASVTTTPAIKPATPGSVNVLSHTLTTAGLSWSLPDNGGSIITGYQVRYSTNGGSSWSSAISTGSTSTSYAVTGLNTGTSYVFQISAINFVGASDWSISTSPLLLAGIPNQVSTLAVSSKTDSSVSLSWTAPTSNGEAITNYIVEFSTDNGISWTTFSHQTSSSTSITVTGLSRGIAHLFRVSAVNGQGAGSTSASANATPQVRPIAPSGITVSIPTLTSLTLAWSAPDNGGSTITGYQVRYSTNSGGTWSNAVNTGSTSPSYVVPGLTTGSSYVFQIAAMNSLGTSDWSLSSPSVQTLIMKSQTITFTAPSKLVLGKPDARLTIKTSAVGLKVKLKVAPSSTKYCSVIGSKIRAKAAGTCKVIATQVGNASYLPAKQVTRVIVIKKR